MSLLSRSARLLSNALKSVAAESITYDRDGVQITIEGIPGRRDNALDLLEGEQASAREFDWIIAANEIVISVTKVEPEKGDKILWTDPDGNVRTYLVVPGVQDRCFRPCDQLGIMYRVHTILQGVA